MNGIRFVVCSVGLLAALNLCGLAHAQDDAMEKALKDAQAKVDELSRQLDESEQAKKVSAGILDPIYALAEHLAFPAFHWIAFSLMATGVISFALQLVFAKLVVLAKSGFSITEILSDALGLAISVIGLVLTTQAAAENSAFSRSPAAVLSASAVGIIAGLVFYRWAQAHEVAAVKGRSVERKES
jgi:hypothetical protein